MENKSQDIVDYEGRILRFKYDSKDLYFDSDRSKAQKNDLFPNSYIVCDWTRKDKNYDIQVIFPLFQDYKYNTYLIYIYYWEGKELIITGFRSLTKYPPVWNREFACGPDYIDYVHIQAYIIGVLDQLGYPRIEYDNNPEGKSFNCADKTESEILDLLKEGKGYGIVSIQAESVPELEKYWKETKSHE